MVVVIIGVNSYVEMALVLLKNGIVRSNLFAFSLYSSSNSFM